MISTRARSARLLGLLCLGAGAPSVLAQRPPLGREVSIERHLEDGEEFVLPRWLLIAHGERLFQAAWTRDEGGGRPFTSGTGTSIADPGAPLVFPRNFNRVSAPDANSCAGCHNLPRAGASGDIVANVFVAAQRFDFASFDAADDDVPLKGSLDEHGKRVTVDTIGNGRATVGMFGSGYVEMLARQMTADLRRLRDALRPGESVDLITKGVSFGVLGRTGVARWDTSEVTGLPGPSLRTMLGGKPSLLIQPFHQAGAVPSLRVFTNNAYNHHHGIQAVERFGTGDPDTDGYQAELTRADVTAVTVYQATLPVPGRVVPRSPPIEAAVLRGERLFADVGCASCHVPALPLDDNGWEYTEPGPFNPPGNLRLGEAPLLRVDLNHETLPRPRLRAEAGITWVPLFSDLKLHDITSGPDDPNREPINQHYPPGTKGFNAGNAQFLTARLWGLANQRPYFHHGKFTTLREAIDAHAGEAAAQAAAFRALASADQASLIEFLKTLRVLPEDAPGLVLDERGQRRDWPPAPAASAPRAAAASSR